MRSVPGRSYLFVPGNRPDRFEKARGAGADAVILDLEDAVPVESKAEARAAVAAWLDPDRPAYVRVNGAATEWFEADLEAIARPGIAGVVLPKAETPDDIARVSARIPEGASVLPLLETAPGVWEARDLAEAPRVERLAFGSIDFQLDTGIDGESEELLYARSRLVLASPRGRRPSPARRRYRRARRSRPAGGRRGSRPTPRVRREALHPPGPGRGDQPGVRTV